MRSEIRIPDAINSSVSKNFTQVPNDLLRNPELSLKAKALLCILLSNREGWRSYMVKIGEMLKEGKEALQTGMKELEQAGYLKRIQFRDKRTKQYRGSFLSYTDSPNNHNLQDALARLDAEGFEVCDTEKPEEKAVDGKPVYGKPAPNNTNSNNTKKTLNIPATQERLKRTTSSKQNPMGVTDQKKSMDDHSLLYKATVEDYLTHLPSDWRRSQELRSALRDYLEGWVQAGRPVIKKQVELQAQKLAEYSSGVLEKAIISTNNSTAHGWTGFWPLSVADEQAFDSPLDKDGQPDLSNSDVCRHIYGVAPEDLMPEDFIDE